MWRPVLAVAAVALLATSAFGFAAPLNVVAGNLQSGSDTSLTCDDEVQVSWNVQWSNTLDTMTVHNVNIGGISGACQPTDVVVVTLTDSVGNFLAQLNTTVASPSVNFGGSVAVPAVYGVNVSIIN